MLAAAPLTAPSPAPPPPLLQLFLEQNEEEAEKMEAKEEKQREIEKSQIKVRQSRRLGGWTVMVAAAGGDAAGERGSDLSRGLAAMVTTKAAAGWRCQFQCCYSSPAAAGMHVRADFRPNARCAALHACRPRAR